MLCLLQNCDSDFFEVLGYKSIIFVAMSCELCSTLHKILSGLSGAKDGLDMKDFHAMTNSDYSQKTLDSCYAELQCNTAIHKVFLILKFD